MVSYLVSDVQFKVESFLIFLGKLMFQGVSPQIPGGPIFNTVSRCLALSHHKSKWKIKTCRIEGIGEKWRAILAHLYTTSDVCTQLNISRSTLYRLIAAGDIEPIKVRNCCRFTEVSINRFIERQIKKTREEMVGF